MTKGIFEKIVDGEIPSHQIYADDHVIAFLDISPANKGHCLVIPKKKFEMFADIPEDELIALTKATQKIAKALSLALGNPGYNILMNNGAVAGQIVPHAHFHIIPRFSDDRLKLNWPHQKYREGEMEKFQEKIKKFL